MAILKKIFLVVFIVFVLVFAAMYFGVLDDLIPDSPQPGPGGIIQQSN